MASGRRAVLLTALTALLAAGGGFGAAGLVLSPADAAARTAPPPAGPITVPVAKGVLRSVITTRGDIAFADPADIELPAGGPAGQVVTGRVPQAGTSVVEGMVLIEVSGRPVIVLGGSFPTYRSLVPGSKGPDVKALQEALIRRKVYSGPINGSYDAATAKAVDALYAALGYQSPAPGQEAKVALEGAKSALRGARQQLAQAENLYRMDSKPVTESERLTAESAVTAAAAAVDKARNTPTPADPAKVTAAQQRLETAKAQAQRTAADLTAAGARLDQARKATPVVPQQVRAAEKELAAARTAAQQAAAQVSRRTGELEAASADGPADRAAIAEAENRLAIAKAQRAELLAGKDSAASRRSVQEARTAVDDALKELSAAQAAVATPFPATEVVYLSDLPRRVDEVKVKKGSAVSGPLLTVSGSELTVTAKVTADEAGLIRKGMAASLTPPAGQPVAASVQSVAQVADEQGSAKQWQVSLVPGRISTAQARELAGTNLKVTIGVGATKGEVLSVPAAGLFSDSQGRPRVEVYAGGVSRFQFVRVGLAAGGDVEVTPVDENGKALPEGEKTLAKGDLVVVGR